MKSEETKFENNEQTQFENNEQTQFDDTQLNGQADENAVTEEENEAVVDEQKRNGSMWKKGAAGMGMGVLLGSVASFISASAMSQDEVDTPVTPEKPEEEIETPAWSDGEVRVATTVNDDMSFSEAFAAARTEVGPGGAFEWHGNVYGTYYADEWENMTPEQREEYNNHFNWNNHTTDTTAATAQNEGDVEVTDAGNANATNGADTNLTHGSVSEENGVEVLVSESDPEVEVLGVYQDEENGVTYAGVMVDDEEIIFIDNNDDMVADIAGIDANDDGIISENEMVDVSSQQIPMEQFENDMIDDTYYASNDGETDYVNDANMDVYEA